MNKSGEIFLNLVKIRRSVRNYRSKAVEKDKIFRCIEAARLAPSACNAQPWSFIVIDDEELKNKVAEQTSNRLLPLNHFTRQAPVHVAVVQEKANITSRLGQTIRDKVFPWMDIGIAAVHFCLQAAAEGLGTCMLGWFNEKNVKQLLGVPASKRVLLIITLGYPADERVVEKKRKSMNEILYYNTYKNRG